MYENFYGFKEKPFSIVPNPDYLFLADEHAGALTHLEYGLAENTGFVLLTGEIGAGKTTLIRHVLNRMPAETVVAEIFQTNVTADQLVELILNELGLAAVSGNKSGNLDILSQYLIDAYADNKKVLLVIDEAQNLSNEALEEIRMISNLHTDDQFLLQILLAGQPELDSRLRSPALKQFSQRIAVSYHLTALKRPETGNYIAHRLEKAGGRSGLFLPDAVDRIHGASGGIPRTINLLCDAALVYGYADEKAVIDVAVIEAVLSDKGGIGIAMPCSGTEAIERVSDAPSTPDGPEHRLDRLEAAVDELRARIEFQIGELEKRARGYEAQIEEMLNQLLVAERKRSDALLVKYYRLKKQYDNLLRAGAPKTGERLVRLEEKRK